MYECRKASVACDVSMSSLAKHASSSGKVCESISVACAASIAALGVDEAEPVRRSQHSSSSSASAETSSANLLVSATLCVDRLSDSMPTMPRLVRCSILFGASMRFATISESTAHAPSWSCSDLERMNE